MTKFFTEKNQSVS